MRDDRVLHLAQMLSSARCAVFFGGAGVSTESGIPDFRSVDGLYHSQWDAPPETILSHSYFTRRPEQFFRFYREKMLFPNARPNPAHLTLARLESMGKLRAVVTQNIDGLHQAAGSRQVIELHGSVHRNHCMSCGAFYDLDFILKSSGMPRCSRCGGIVKPDVVLYEEALPEAAVEAACDHLNSADLVIIGGTSLSVYPAAAFVQSCPGEKVIINRSSTPMDQTAALCIDRPIGQVLAECLPNVR